MPPEKHAVLSASSAHRWLNCTPSALLEQLFPGRESNAAAEGTAAHALCEHKLRRALKMQSRKPHSKYHSDEMDEHTDAYVQFVLETLAEARQTCPDPVLLMEQRLDFSSWVPGGFGTGDCIIIADDLLHIIDFKYGQGVLVEAAQNPQMMLYALGAISAFGCLYDINRVAMTIYQPRRANVSTWEIPVAQLQNWAEHELVPRALLAAAGEGDFCPGEWCRFCRAAVKCKARAEEKLDLVRYEFADPPLLSDEDIAAILPRLDDLTHWAADIATYAEEAAINQGKSWPGFKVVEGRTVRRYADEDAVIQAAREAGYTDIYRRKLLSITDMEKLMGRKNFQAVLGHLIEKPAGLPTLVPESDKRPAIDTVNTDFNDK